MNTTASRGRAPDGASFFIRRTARLVLTLLFSIFLFGFSSLLGPPVTQAQNSQEGTVAGVIVDGEHGETLPGANVQVVGTQRGTSTDLDGRYEIRLPAGTYDLKYSFISYQSKTVTGVEVTAGETAPLDVTLQPATQELETVVVTAAAARNSEAGLLRQRQKAAGVSDAVSAETISESGSSDAADAMEKVTGASVIGGKYVNVRGLGGRYVNTTLNGAALPSADPDENAVPFDLFPSNLLERIVVSKTFTPDKAGSFTGGSIDIGTVAFPSEFNLSVSSAVEYNSAVGYGEERVGFVEGLDEIPGAVPEEGVSPVPANPSPTEAQQYDAITKAFGTALAPLQQSIPVDQSYELSFGNEFALFGDRPLGVVANASYGRNISGYEGGTNARYPLSSSGAEALTATLNLDDASSTVEDLYSGLANLSFRPFSNHEVGVNFLYSRSEEREGRFQQGFSSELTGGSETVFQTRVSHKTVREVVNGQIRGEHVFGRGLLERLFGSNRGMRLAWKGSLSRTTQDEPDYRQFATEFDTTDGTFGRLNPATFPPPTRYFRNLEEDGRTAEGSLEIPVAFLDLKVGGNYTDEDRSFSQRRFIYQTRGSIPYEGNNDVFFGRRAGLTDVNGDGTVGETELGNTIAEQTRATDNYDGGQTVTAGFAMIDAPVPGLPDLRLIGGVRVERTDQSVTPGSDDPADRGRIEETDVLPSANLVYALTDEMNVRAAYGRTLARPSFREFAPVTFQPFLGAFNVSGNPGLQRTLVDNFDLRWEWFLSPGELLAVSGFYKDFTDPIERVFNPFAFNPTISYINSENATVYGAELEVRKSLGFLADAEWLKDLKVGGNLTLTQSEVTIPDSLQNGSDDARPLQGQSPYLVNANLSYENPNWGTSAGIYYNVFGERLAEITRDLGPNRFEQPRHTLDVIFSQRFLLLGLEDLEVRLKAKNLLGAAFEVTRAYRGEHYPVRRYDLGRSFTLGLEYAF